MRSEKNIKQTTLRWSRRRQANFFVLVKPTKGKQHLDLSEGPKEKQ